LRIEGVVTKVMTLEVEKVPGILFVVPVTDRKTGKPRDFEVRCQFTNVPEAEREKLRTVKVGQTLRVNGDLTGPSDAWVMLNWCVLAGKDDPPSRE